MQVFSVEGMTCGHCVRAVTQAVQSQDPDAEVTVDLATKQVRVQSLLEREAIAQLIKEEGYTVV
ncbi:heavy-metal-associated domain-containing protein [Pseudomonas fluorescens]|uniref:Heavy-metal-associated domain-containing protein n=1 Tax=Pseudomonas fluorescens TaxID=294 RepID=A0AAE2Q4B7_PSEFL|nr:MULTISPECIES: cation transporter [Pseudomonas fluorescens group]MBA1430033.1 heavy-metal-associated domain-containing protein [Pseudomonas orientalis]MBD8151126.1 heavy-metal-associated domain-containing protein [Pseudomonas fluorescens]MBD8178806.1 heavy-metal-associated domain-containing protein [Pseudomonas fluorescens]MBD8273304.1 heavy-metal-associated domain-containing protein [Pseudomonas fluorescens]MBD8748452.1 heavy-metal-associated domain-containing protein [Pseudomonas fluoresce